MRRYWLCFNWVRRRRLPGHAASRDAVCARAPGLGTEFAYFGPARRKAKTRPLALLLAGVTDPRQGTMLLLLSDNVKGGCFVHGTCGLVAMTSAQHAEGRQLELGQV